MRVPSSLAPGAFLSFALLVAGCARSGPEDAPSNAVALLREASVGPCMASVALSTGEVEAGVPIEVQLQAEAPAALTIALPDDAAFAPFQVVRRHPLRPETPSAEDHRRVAQRVLVRTFTAGELDLPALPFTFSEADPGGADTTGTTGTSETDPDSTPATLVIETEPIPVMVVTLLEDPFDPAVVAELRPAMTVEDEPLSPWIVGAIAVGAIVLLAGVVGALVRRGRRPITEPDPETWALAALTSLRGRELPGRGDIEPFFVELTSILREYLRRRTGFDAPMKTSAEFVEGLRRDARLSDEQRGALSDLAHLSDMVKFGRHAATPSECERAMGSVERLVELLRPRTEGETR